MSVEFFKTMMGRKFFEADLPRLIKAIEKLNKKEAAAVIKKVKDLCEAESI